MLHSKQEPNEKIYTTRYAYDAQAIYWGTWRKSQYKNILIISD